MGPYLNLMIQATVNSYRHWKLQLSWKYLIDFFFKHLSKCFSVGDGLESLISKAMLMFCVLNLTIEDVNSQKKKCHSFLSLDDYGATNGRDPIVEFKVVGNILSSYMYKLCYIWIRV